LAPELKFLLGGEGWGSRSLPSNVRWIGHVGTADHNRINCSARMVLNINRDSMANIGFSPPTRVFEAAGAGACLITDAWMGVEQFFLPGHEILVASRAEDIVRWLRQTPLRHSQALGTAMRARALRDHTYALRAREFQHLVRREATSSRAAASELDAINVGSLGSLAQRRSLFSACPSPQHGAMGTQPRFALSHGLCGRGVTGLSFSSATRSGTRRTVTCPIRHSVTCASIPIGQKRCLPCGRNYATPTWPSLDRIFPIVPK